MTLVKKELRQELFWYQRGLRSLSITSSSKASLRKRRIWRRFQLYWKQCGVPTVLLLEHIGSGKKQSRRQGRSVCN